MDVLFLIDCSESLGSTGWADEEQFVKAFVSKLDLGQNASRVAVLTFNHLAKPRMGFNDPQSQDSVNKLLDSLTYEEGGTNIQGAFLKGKDLLTGFKRRQVPQVVILLTDGNHEARYTKPRVDAKGKPVQPWNVAEEFVKQGIIVYAIGVGVEPSKDQLEKYAGDPSHAFLISFNELKNEETRNVIGADVIATVNL